MLGADGEARLTDFSLAGLRHLSTLTGHDSIVGSPAYMAPELLRGSRPDARSDLYGLGIVLLEASTGSNPFQAADPLSSIQLVQNVSPPKLAGRQRLDPALAGLIDVLLNKDPAERPKSAEVALSLLNTPAGEHSVTDERGTDTSVGRVYSPDGRLQYAALSVVALAVLLAVTMVGNQTIFHLPHAKPIKIKPVVSGTVDPGIIRESPTPGNSPRTFDAGKINERAESARASTTGVMVLLVKPWGNVSVDGVFAGATPMKPMVLTTGKHSLVISHPQLPTLKREMIVEPGKRDTLQFDLRSEAAAANVTAIPWGYLWVDGDSLGLLPRSDPIWISAGQHRLSIYHPEYGTWSEMVSVSRGEKVNFRVNLANGTLIATPSTGEKQGNGD